MAGRTLTVYLAADTSKFKSHMASAGDSVDGPDGLRGRIGGLAGSLNDMLGPALLGAGIAVGALALKFAGEGIKSAMDEAAELEKLHLTLKNLGFEDEAANVDKFIEASMRATTYTDSELRPAFETLLLATDNVRGAQDLLTLSLDAAKGSNRDLETVTRALAKAEDGNTSALQRMFPWLDKNLLKTEGMDYATQALADRFNGQAIAAADSWTGRLGNASKGFDELKESFGTGFLTGLENAETKTDNFAGALYDLQDPASEIGSTLGEMVITLGKLSGGLFDAQKDAETFAKTIGPLGDGLLPFINPLQHILDLLNGIPRAIDLAKSALESLPSIDLGGSPSPTTSKRPILG